ncbi:hypothetical protein D0B54_09660 [Solimonas sp. K1W22B-7]|uniref:PLDc N-terminal domain-containing protein n=1 Tax=Solimonas sp. K1W22B-7 TaxID=2303331 RepID=UPI000E32F859|nr:PLDc N-terminal domain-containing protein [Solimonas sp. K1W22B-7]AXQ28936.1 hypothetical protein D0B54_09660 [Solimonas sp. K1W22B-7]
MNYGYGGIFGILVLIAVVYAVINIAQSGADPGRKALWIVLLLLPVLGLILWFFLGPKSGR